MQDNRNEETKTRYRLVNKLLETVDVPGVFLEISRLKRLRK